MNSQGKHFFGANFAMLEAGPFFRKEQRLERRSLFVDKLLLIVSILEKMAHLTFEERKLVASVAEFFQLGKVPSSLINVNNVARRTAEACRVSESTAKRCRREAEKESKENNAIDSKEVQYGRGRPKVIIDEFTASAIRRAGLYIRSIAYENIPVWIKFLPVARRM